MKAHKYDEGNMKDDTRLALLEQSIGHINESLIRIDKRFDKIDSQFDRIEERFNRLDDKIEKVRTLSWSHFRWIMGSILTLFGTVIGSWLQGHLG